MKKCAPVLCVLFTTVLILPSAADVSTPTLKQLARTVAALQKMLSVQATTIASQNTTIAFPTFPRRRTRPIVLPTLRSPAGRGQRAAPGIHGGSP